MEQQPPNQPYGQPPLQGPPPTNYGNQPYPPAQPYGAPGYPPVPPPQKKRSWIARHPIWTGIIAFLLFSCIVGNIANAGKGTSTDTTANTGTTAQQQSSTPAPTDTPTPTPKPLKWTTTHTFTGNGDKKTETFTAPDDWKILWSCNPANNVFGQYNIIVEVMNSDGTPADPTAINTICKSGNISGDTEERQGGQVYLDVSSEDAWTFTIQELK